jgi:hypothetical protein
LEWGEAVILDIDKMKNFEKFVIHCATEDQADELFKIISNELPKKLAGWTSGYTHWDFYQDRTCYALYVDRERAAMQFSSISFWKSQGYKIIPFYDIIWTKDLGEIRKDECFDTNLLYEIGV